MTMMMVVVVVAAMMAIMVMVMVMMMMIIMIMILIRISEILKTAQDCCFGIGRSTNRRKHQQNCALVAILARPESGRPT